jgi:hypothetical protein
VERTHQQNVDRVMKKSTDEIEVTPFQWNITRIPAPDLAFSRLRKIASQSLSDGRLHL